MKEIGDVVFTNDSFAVLVAESPATPDADTTVVYSVVNKTTGVAEYYTNQLYEALQNAYWLDFMLKDKNWEKVINEKAAGFIQHFALPQPIDMAHKLTATGPLN